MPKFEESVDIRCPVDAVFAAVTDPYRGRDWNPNIIDVSDVNPYPVQLGTQWTQIVRVNGRPITLQCRVVSWHPPTHGLLEVSGSQSAQIETRCTAIPAGTRLVQVVDFVMPGGALGALASGFARSALQREIRQGMERQRRALEAEPQPQREG